MRSTNAGFPFGQSWKRREGSSPAELSPNCGPQPIAYQKRLMSDRPKTAVSRWTAALVGTDSTTHSCVSLPCLEPWSSFTIGRSLSIHMLELAYRNGRNADHRDPHLAGWI